MTVTTRDIARYADVDLYDVLHLTAQAGAELIDRAYRLRMSAVHPDHAWRSSPPAPLVNRRRDAARAGVEVKEERT